MSATAPRPSRIVRDSSRALGRRGRIGRQDARGLQLAERQLEGHVQPSPHRRRLLVPLGGGRDVARQGDEAGSERQQERGHPAPVEARPVDLVDRLRRPSEITGPQRGAGGRDRPLEDRGPETGREEDGRGRRRVASASSGRPRARAASAWRAMRVATARSGSIPAPGPRDAANRSEAVGSPRQARISAAMLSRSTRSVSGRSAAVDLGDELEDLVPLADLEPGPGPVAERAGRDVAQPEAQGGGEPDAGDLEGRPRIVGEERDREAVPRSQRRDHQPVLLGHRQRCAEQTVPSASGPPRAARRPLRGERARDVGRQPQPFRVRRARSAHSTAAVCAVQQVSPGQPGLSSTSDGSSWSAGSSPSSSSAARMTAIDACVS